MRRNISKLLIFVGLFTLAYYGIYYCLFNTEYNDRLSITYLQKNIPLKPSILSKAFAEMERENDLDILFIGSSHCQRGFDPKYFEEEKIKTFNLGSIAQTPVNSYFLLKKYIHKTQNVVLEIFPATYNFSGNESFFEILSANNEYPFLLEQAIALKQFSPLQTLSLKPFIDAEISEKQLDKCIYRKGYIQVNDSAKNKNVKYVPLTLIDKNTAFQFKYLKKIIALCKENNKRLILVYAPIPSKFVFTNEVQFKTELYKILKENDLNFIDMSRKHGLNDENNFYDDDHLNTSGVMLFNKALIRELRNILK